MDGGAVRAAGLHAHAAGEAAVLSARHGDAASALFSALRRVRVLHFTARSEVPVEWNGEGSGVVELEAPDDRTLTFTETGRWQPAEGGPLRFRNVYRWSVVERDRVRLEHLRLGAEMPVRLLDLVTDGRGGWAAEAAHQCGEDRYVAELRPEGDGLTLAWRIQGPRKVVWVECWYGAGALPAAVRRALAP